MQAMHDSLNKVYHLYTVIKKENFPITYLYRQTLNTTTLDRQTLDTTNSRQAKTRYIQQAKTFNKTQLALYVKLSHFKLIFPSIIEQLLFKEK